MAENQYQLFFDSIQTLEFFMHYKYQEDIFSYSQGKDDYDRDTPSLILDPILNQDKYENISQSKWSATSKMSLSAF